MTVSIDQLQLHKAESGPHRFTAEDYLRISEQGILAGQKTEFIDGEILDVASQQNDHAYSVTIVSRIFRSRFDEMRNWIRTQMTLRALENFPEPDIAIMSYAPKPGRDIPESVDALLVVEISDSTLLYDTTIKASLYASSSVKDYWVLNIPDRALIVHRDPMTSTTSKFGMKYGSVTTFLPGNKISSLAVPTASFDPVDLFPPVTPVT